MWRALRENARLRVARPTQPVKYRILGNMRFGRALAAPTSANPYIGARMITDEFGVGSHRVPIAVNPLGRVFPR